jgi:hypothetical protein
MNRRKHPIKKKHCSTNHAQRVSIGEGRMQCTCCGDTIRNVAQGRYGWEKNKGLPHLYRYRSDRRSKGVIAV